jgi:hypothetical protein
MSETNDTTTVATDERESGRHPVNVGHLVMGIALLGLVAAWALIVGDVVEGGDVRWLLPAPWVLGGAAGLVALAVTGSRGREKRQVGWVRPDETDETDETTETTEETP